MDLIGSIKFIASTKGKRFFKQPNNRPALKNTRNNGTHEKPAINNEQSPSSVWEEIQVGRNIDTSA